MSPPEPSTPMLARIKRHASEITAFRSAGDPPAYEQRDSLMRMLHRDCPAASARELAEAESWIRRCCGC